MKQSLLLFFLSSLGTAPAQAHLNQVINVQLTPALKSLVVQDHIKTRSALHTTYQFQLNKNLTVTLLSGPDDRLKSLPTSSSLPYVNYELDLGSDREALLEYTGMIFDPVKDNASSGLISPEGAVLFGSSYWLPSFNEFTTYEINQLHLPPDWILASPSQQKLPQPEVYLIAGPFKVFPLESTPSIPFTAYLRSEEPALAQALLAPLPKALALYEKTIGSFPYDSFSIIENFWETGYGMPGFTLLGPGVIRLPYILNSSLPHELLHNWWGNSVYVDPARGNWSEGLTTYMADYAFLTDNDARREYRQNVLMAYQDYTKTSGDFPLREFKGRHNSSTQAIGYGKGMMFFHMLKQSLSAATFDKGLQAFYAQNRAQAVSFEELQSSFEKASGKNLNTFFTQWLDRKGAPEIKILKSSPVHLQLGQSEPPYQLRVPIKWTFADGSTKWDHLSFNHKTQDFHFQWESAPRKLEVDPDFEVFRSLDPAERPSALSNVFGANSLWITAVEASSKKIYSEAWKTAVEGLIQETDDSILQNAPPKGAVVLIGESAVYENFFKTLLREQDFSSTPSLLRILGQDFDRHSTTTILVAKNPKLADVVYVWIRGPKNIDSYAPRLLHYGKYGVLVFEEKRNLLKTQWPIFSSPLKVEWP